MKSVSLLSISETGYSKIVDDHYEHALRLFQDRDSDGIRLQASVYRGELARYFSCHMFLTSSFIALIRHRQETRLDGLCDSSDQLSALDAPGQLKNHSPRRSATTHFR